MKIGLFDHIEHGERPTRAAVRRAAEIHPGRRRRPGSTACILPSTTRRRSTWCRCRACSWVRWRALTKQIKMGPLVYLLPLYSPLRMIDEICMLDHLSHGRAEIGVGRGVSPFELKYHKIEHDQSRDIFIDAYECVSAGLTTETARPTRVRTISSRTCRSRCGRCSSRIRRSGTAPPAPRARPGRASTACISSRSGRTNSPRPTSTRFKAAFAKRGNKPAQPKPEFSGGIAIGVQRHIFVDETDEKAKAWAKPAMDNHLSNINWLRNKHGVTATAIAYAERARHDLRGMRRRRHRDRGLAQDRAGRDREAARPDRLQLSADVSLPRHHVGRPTPCARLGCSPPR